MPLTPRVLDRRVVHTLGDYIDGGGGSAWHAAQGVSTADVIDLLIASGLRGRGGAGFPTGTKWRTISSSRSSKYVTTVVVNAAEGEPGTFKDRALLRTNPYRVLEGALVAAITMQTDQIRIGIKATFHREIARLRSAIAEMRAARWLEDVDIALVLGPSSYLFGEETALLEVVEGRQPFPRVTPPYRRGLQDDDTRSVVGVRLATPTGSGGAPALVDNVETLANVPLIVEHGVDWFREMGTDRSPGTIVCTVTGATRRSGVGEVALGSTLHEVIDLLGWGPRRGREITVVLAGTANALIPARLLDTELTYEAMHDAGSGLGSAGFVVFDDSTAPAEVAAGVARFLSVESCGQCEPCKLDGLQIAEELRRSLAEPSTPIDLAILRRRINTITNGARCNLAQQQASVVGSLLDLFPTSLRRSSSRTRTASSPVTIAPIEDLVGGRARLDARQLTKQPDWSYDDTDSGASPAARLGNTPVHIADVNRPREWPEWTADVPAEHPLEIIDDAHEAIHELIDAAIGDGDDRDRAVDEVVLAIRTHVDVTQRVLYPMLRRVGADQGEELADAAEVQEKALLELLARIGDPDPRSQLRDIGAEMLAHAELEDAILDLLRSRLDPIERSGLADGLAAARVTSTVSRLVRLAGSAVATAPRAAAQDSVAPAIERPQLEAPGTATDAGVVLAVVPADGEAPFAVHDSPPPQPPPTSVASGSSDEVPPPTRSTSRKKIIVGADGSAAAAAALRWAGRLAGRAGAEIVVANVFESVQAEVSPIDYDSLLARTAEDLATTWCAPLSDSGVAHQALLLTGGPDRLLSAVQEQGADLLVVGTRGAGRFAALHVGSLAHHFAHHTRGPLAIVPAAGAECSFDRIVVGVDGSAGSAVAVDWCADIGAATGAEVIAVCAFDATGGRGPRPFDDTRWRETAERAISDRWIAPLIAAGVKVRTRIIEGQHPVTALAGAVDQEDAGMVVVGTRGVSEVLGRRLGRVPLQLVHHTHRPVILVPPVAAQVP